MAGNWQPLTDVQDGQVVDFEVLSSLINNSNYLKDHAVSAQSNRSGVWNENSALASGWKMKIVGGVIGFDMGTKTYDDVNLKYSSKTDPIVLVSVHNCNGATASTYSINKSGGKCRVSRTGTGDKKGSIFWIAITTVDA